MTVEGPATIVKTHDDGDVEVRWHKSAEPMAVYTINEEDVWLAKDHPEDIYDENGKHIQPDKPTVLNARQNEAGLTNKELEQT